MKIEALWEMYEKSLWQEKRLEKMSQDSNESGFELIEKCTQNGITNGILRSLEELEGDKPETWRKSHAIFCKVKGIDVNTGFGFWVPMTERQPKEEDNFMISLDDGFVATAYWNGDDWELWADSGEVLAWMPLPAAYEV